MNAVLRSVEEVRAEILAHARCTSRLEQVPAAAALNRILAEDVVARVDVPPADNSAMDGYALNTLDPAVQEGASLPVSDRIPAGQVGQPLLPGTLARIFTGANMPEGSDAVLIQEDTSADGELVRIDEMPKTGAWVRPRGQDMAKGAVAISAGTQLGPQHLGLMASVGITEVRAFRPLRVAIFSTGDELKDPPEPLGPGQIYNSNRATLTGLLKMMGLDVFDLGRIADDLAATEWALSTCAARADIIITSGGVSVGEEDYVKQALDNRGRLETWKVAMKPGKPVAFGFVDEVPFFGLPGNPVSTYVSFLLFVKPFLLKQQGCLDVLPKSYLARAGFRIKGGRRREYVRVRQIQQADGSLMLELFDNQSSGVLSSLTWAEALAEIEINTMVEPGDLVPVYPLL